MYNNSQSSGSQYPRLQRPRQEMGSNFYETPILDSMDTSLAEGLSECYIERERVIVGDVITCGNFGEVYKGKLRQRDDTMVNVAIKSLKTLTDADDIQKFLREGVMMRGLDHPNVLQLLGVCVDTGVEHGQSSPLIILPYMKYGDLRTFLRDGNNVLTVLRLLRFCGDVANGMAYLAEKKFVHRDLAARNCMVSKSWQVKVADFGLSRDLFDRDYYKSSVKTQLPLKWMPPESIKYGRYTEKSDVWSYGIVCWEVMTRGAIPYPTIQAQEILTFLGDGSRMERPECCPFKLYNLMNQCWLEEPDTRPTFEQLGINVGKIIKDARNSIKNRQKQQQKEYTSATSPTADEEPSTSHNPQYQNSMRENDKPRPKPRSTSSASNIDRSPGDGGSNRGSIKSDRDVTTLNRPVTDIDVGEYQDDPESRNIVV